MPTQCIIKFSEIIDDSKTIDDLTIGEILSAVETKLGVEIADLIYDQAYKLTISEDDEIIFEA